MQTVPWSHCTGLEPSPMFINSLAAVPTLAQGVPCVCRPLLHTILGPQSKEDVFLLISLRTPPPVISFPVPGHISSQNDSQWNAHFFQGEFHRNLHGCHWLCALPTKIRHSLQARIHFPSLQLSSIPFQCLTPRKAQSKSACSSCSPSSALQPQMCFSKENSTWGNGAVCVHSWERDLSFINTASVPLPALSQGLDEHGAHRGLTLPMLMGWPEGQQM